MFSTARNRVFANFILSYALLARSEEKTLIIGRTVGQYTETNRASISFVCPVNEPPTVFCPFHKSLADNSNDSQEPVTITSSLLCPAHESKMKLHWHLAQ
jgi:hypothetical protein